jgi:hypothetical protein
LLKGGEVKYYEVLSTMAAKKVKDRQFFSNYPTRKSKNNKQGFLKNAHYFKKRIAIIS